MRQEAVLELTGSYIIDQQGTSIDFSGDWPIRTFRQLILKDTGIDINVVKNLESLKNEIQKRKLERNIDNFVGYGSLLDALY
ncbi:hypothetical protein ACQKMD_19300 [Viridibacillus sp. NPDC096237]|uniref:hypothetical protein n=1 Tax=Viridibacillus sp. NPDC096237 TaxID=3390721 RepID=UPI003D05EA4D